MDAGRRNAPAALSGRTDRENGHRSGRRTAVARAPRAGPASRPARRPRSGPRTYRRIWSARAVAPRPGRRRFPGPVPAAADDARRRCRPGNAGPETAAATRSSARPSRTARRDRATGRRSRDSSGGPVVHGRAPVVGSRPLAHGDVTSSEMVALGAPGTGKVARPGTEWLPEEGSGAGSVTATAARIPQPNVILQIRTFRSVMESDFRRYSTRRRPRVAGSASVPDNAARRRHRAASACRSGHGCSITSTAKVSGSRAW